jgi:ATP-binding cassette subfamily B multidrug efflux pump
MKKESQHGPIRRQLAFFWKNYKKQIIIGAIAILSIDIAELYLPLLLRDTVDSFSNGHAATEHRKNLLQGLFIVVFFQVFGRYLWRVALSRSAMLVGAEFRNQFSHQSFKISIPNMEAKRVGDLMTLATSDVENMRFALGPGIIGIIDSCFYCIALPIAMYSIAPELTWKILLPVACIPFVVLFLQRKIAIQSNQVQSQIGKLGTLTQEMISGVRIIKTYGLEKNISSKLNKVSHELNKRQVAMTRTQSRLGPSMEFFLSTSIILLFSIPGYSVGTLVAMQRYLQKLLWPLTASAMSVILFQKSKSSGKVFYEYVDDPNVELEKSELNTLGFKKGVPVIEARNLNFSYESGKSIIKNLSFKIYEGEWIGFSGPVGSGKSTILQLLLKFYPVERGQLFVNGTDIEDYAPQEVRSYFSSVLQDPYLFQGTLLENLNTGDELQSLSWTMKVSGMHEDEFMHRMDQKLGERGTGLSGGQKQRVGIARAIRKASPILLFDDPLSSVDMSTAEYVLRKMTEELRPMNKTVIFVSHHEEHLLFCDRVIKL